MDDLPSTRQDQLVNGLECQVTFCPEFEKTISLCELSTLLASGRFILEMAVFDPDNPTMGHWT